MEAGSRLRDAIIGIMSELKEALSERELEILRLVATGAANKEIARQLVISPNTVKVHMRNIFAKIGVASRTEATLYAVQIGLVNPSAVGMTVESDPNGEGKLAGTPAADDLRGSAVVYAEPRVLEPPARPTWTRWQIAAVVLLALVLIGSGAALGARLLGAPTPAPQATQGANAQFMPVQRWSSNTTLPEARKGMGVVEYENAFYILAGEGADGIDPSTLRFNPTSNSWETLADKPTPVSEIQAALLGEKIYVPGGKLSDGSLTEQMEVYDPREDSWERRADLPAAVSGYALAALEGRLYLFGGRGESGYLDEVYEYDPGEDRWSPRASMDHPRAFAGAAVVGGKIYIMGGYDGKQSLRLNQAYMPSRDGSGVDPWETYTPLPEPRHGMGATVLASGIYLVGGWDDEGNSGMLGPQQYSVQEDQWAAFDRPPQAAGALPGLIASGNFLYVLGGETDTGLSDAVHIYQAIYTIAVPIISSDR